MSDDRQAEDVEMMRKLAMLAPKIAEILYESGYDDEANSLLLYSGYALGMASRKDTASPTRLNTN